MFLSLYLGRNLSFLSSKFSSPNQLISSPSSGHISVLLLINFANLLSPLFYVVLSLSVYYGAFPAAKKSVISSFRNNVQKTVPIIFILCTGLPTLLYEYFLELHYPIYAQGAGIFEFILGLISQVVFWILV